MDSIVVALNQIDELCRPFRKGATLPVTFGVNAIALLYRNQIDILGRAVVTADVKPGLITATSMLGIPNMVFYQGVAEKILPTTNDSSEIPGKSHREERPEGCIVTYPFPLRIRYHSLQQGYSLIPRNPGQEISVIGLLGCSAFNTDYQVMVEVEQVYMLEFNPFATSFGQLVPVSGFVEGLVDISNYSNQCVYARVRVLTA